MTKKTQNRVELLSPELVKFSSLKNLPILSNHRNFRQNWWQKKHKIWWNYCHQNWWHFRHSKTHQILQFTKIFAKIGEKFGENSIENSNHQNFRQNWWKFWRKFNRKWMWSPTSYETNVRWQRGLEIHFTKPLLWMYHSCFEVALIIHRIT